ncbi:hypothetical protein [Alteromonas flava]|uniref:hypothetical protein n=1 Tax=Alteromonas flava TaxID=2048003 RepID=UPI000C2950F0|nr:hypothetical protein [Alteromonas flava]
MSRLLVIFLFLLGNAVAADEPFIVSYPPHYEIEPCKKIVQRAYADLGITVEFVELPVERRLFSLSKGLTDADVGARQRQFEQYENIDAVPLSLTTVYLYLLCHSKDCSPQVLKNERLKVHSTHFGLGMLKTLFGDDVKAQITTIENYRTLIDMFHLRRAESIVYVTGKDLTQWQQEHTASVALLHETPLYHVVNHRHAALIRPLTRALRKHLMASQRIE